jgi:hypothetical protein
MPSRKKAFVFADDARAVMTPEARGANALEFIAHYLGRIDGHLEALAGQTQAGNANTAKIALELTGIARSVGRLAGAAGP